MIDCSTLVAWLNRYDDPGAVDTVLWLATGLGLLVLGISAFAIPERSPSRHSR